MKIRWTSSSIRLRITPSELATLERGEPLEERLHVPLASDDSSWMVILLPGSNQTNISASGSVVLFDVSREDMARLSDPESEGIYCRQQESTGDQDQFAFYIEKDFPCVHPRGAELLEKPTETFSPPTGFSERKI